VQQKLHTHHRGGHKGGGDEDERDVMVDWLVLEERIGQGGFGVCYKGGRRSRGGGKQGLARAARANRLRLFSAAPRCCDVIAQLTRPIAMPDPSHTPNSHTHTPQTPGMYRNIPAAIKVMYARQVEREAMKVRRRRAILTRTGPAAPPHGAWTRPYAPPAADMLSPGPGPGPGPTPAGRRGDGGAVGGAPPQHRAGAPRGAGWAAACAPA
jgi:hypothetical protein